MQGCPILLEHGTTDSRPVASAMDPATGEPALWVDRQGRTCCKMWHDLSTSIGRDCWSLISRNLLLGCSIGFLPLEKTHRHSGRTVSRFEQGGGGYDIKSVEIAEVSLSATPSNWHCSLLSRSKAARQFLVRKSITAAGRISESHGQQMQAWFALERIEAKLDSIRKATKDAKVGPTDRVSVLSNHFYIPGG